MKKSTRHPRVRLAIPKYSPPFLVNFKFAYGFPLIVTFFFLTQFLRLTLLSDLRYRNVTGLAPRVSS